MAKPLLSRLKRVIQKLGIEDLVPHHDHPGKLRYELQKALDVYLSFSECHRELGISGNFDPRKLPLVPVAEVKTVTDDDSTPPFMKPFFSTVTADEIARVTSQVDSKRPPLLQAPFDSDDFLACRMFFQLVVRAVEEGYRIVLLKDNARNQWSLVLHIKELRMLTAFPDTVRRELKETVLLQGFGRTTASEEDYEKILLDISRQHRKSTGETLIRIIPGTPNQVHFVAQVLLAHELLLKEIFVSEHDRQWNPKHKLIRPSFIVPIVPLSRENLQEIKGSFETACEPALRSGTDDILEACAVCGETNVKLKLCSKCTAIKYCSRECQIADWKSHKRTCRAKGSDPKGPHSGHDHFCKCGAPHA